MKVAVFYNPASGRGDGESFASFVEKELKAAGIEVVIAESQQDPREIETALDASLEYLVLIGGDGTVLPYLEVAAKLQIPLYVMPGGNESLFSKAFGVTRDIASLLASLKKGLVREHFYGLARSKDGKQTAFFSMLSIGLDSFVVADIARTRSGPIGKRGYILPLLRQLFSYRAPELTLLLDEKEVLRDRRGAFVLANNSSYAGKLAPVPEASSCSATLVLRFFSEMSRCDYLGWGIAYLRKMAVNIEETEVFSGSSFEISSKTPVPIQVDGDYWGETPVSVCLSALRVPVLELAAE